MIKKILDFLKQFFGWFSDEVISSIDELDNPAIEAGVECYTSTSDLDEAWDCVVDKATGKVSDEIREEVEERILELSE